METEVFDIKRILKLHHFYNIGLMIPILVLWGKVKSLSIKITKLEDN